MGKTKRDYNIEKSIRREINLSTKVVQSKKYKKPKYKGISYE